MRKGLLLSLLTMMFGLFAVNATTLKITVDHADNVTITDGNGAGTVLELTDGLNTFEADSSQNPFVIKANEGAEIVSVIYNDNEQSASYDGTYRFGVGGPETTVVITTSGQGVPPTPQVKYTNFNVYAMGEGITGSPFTLLVQKDGEWVAPDAGDYGMAYKVPENDIIKIAPTAPYEIVSASVQMQSEPLDVTRNDDGSIEFANVIPDYYSLNLEMKVSDNALRFSITVDYPGNIHAWMEWQRTGEHGWDALQLKPGVNDIVTVPEANPLELVAVEGGEILQVTLNGEVAQPIGWGGSGGYVFSVNSGDEFVISTKGPEVEMDINVNDRYTAKLQDFFFTRNDGSQIKLEGTSAKIKGNQGEYIYVSGRPGTDYQMMMGTNGAEYDMQNWKDWFRMTPGLDGENPAGITLYANRNITGVVVDVDDASRVQVTQEGGRGETLTLTNGVNNFALADIKNALAISTVAGNEIMSVTLNGDPVTVNAQGNYLINVAESDYVQIRSRKSPVEAELSFTLNDGMAINNVRMTVNGVAMESVSPLKVQSYSTVTVAAASGYVLENVTTEEASIIITDVEGTVSLYLSSADMTEATIALQLKEIEPSEGNAIVVPNGDALMLQFSEFEYLADEDRYVRVKTLENNTVNEVKIGNYVQIYRKDSQAQYRYVKVNGEEIDDLSSRAILVKIEGRTTIEAEVYTPTYVYSTDTFDSEKHVKMGRIEFEVNGERVRDFYAEPGMTCKFIPVAEPGYIFERVEFFYPLTFADDGMVIDSETYTFTEEDCANEFLLFKGVFKVDESKPVYAVRGTTAWLVDEDGNISGASDAALGTVVFQLNDGTYGAEVVCFEGDQVIPEIQVYDPTIFEEYEVAGFCLTTGFPNSVITSPYTVNAADAESDGSIWISGMIRKKTNSVAAITGEGFSYDAAAGMLRANGALKVYAVNGTLVAEAENGEVSTSSLAAGIYVAVAEGKTFKFTVK